MSAVNLILLSTGYLITLFVCAWFFRKHDRFSNTKYAYALSICVYCTAWTFYGSIGRSAETGFGYLGVYLGPTIVAPLMLVVLTKTIKISKYLRISSIADFISSRYGKSSVIGAVATLLCLMIVIPYISIQLKALNLSFKLIVEHGSATDLFLNNKFYADPALIFGMVCAAISMFFGTIKAAPTDRHPGIITVIAIESILKLAAFLIGALCIIYYLNSGLSEIFSNYDYTILHHEFLSLKNLTNNGNSWFWISLISAIAFLILPRQFHMSVIENKEVKHVKFACWFVPLYLFSISIFVLPIALEGRLLGNASINPDNYLNGILLNHDLLVIALIVFVGGIAASTGMIISSLISLSIMISNHLILPLLLKVDFRNYIQLEVQLIGFRRLLILVILLLSYAFYQIYAINYSLVSIGLISFVGISQLFPAYILGLYWKFANSKGALAGLITGIGIWAFTLPIMNLCEMGILDQSLISNGLFGFGFLKPQALFGVENLDPISHSSFWSLSSNLIMTCLVSLFTDRKALEIAQSDIFLHPDKYIKGKKMTVFSKEANFKELNNILNEILGKDKVKKILAKYKAENEIELFDEYADTAFIQYIENYLSGSIGSPSTRIILDNIVKNEPVKPDQLFKVLDQTNQLYEYSKALEEKRDELNETTSQLFEANSKLKELDQLKNEFISNVTHELRTPLTSINSLADSLDEFEIEPDEKKQIIKIIKQEAERISSLVNQVLDLRKLETKSEVEAIKFNVNTTIQNILIAFSDSIQKREIVIEGDNAELFSDINKFKQIVINILANAIKFTKKKGKIRVKVITKKNFVTIHFIDNGIGIPEKDIQSIFDRFYQSKNISKKIHRGSGLGLSISKSLIELLHGNISVKSQPGIETIFTITIPNYNPEYENAPEEETLTTITL